MIGAMFIREIKKPNGSTAICIVETFRDGERVRHKIIRSLGQHKDPTEIALIKKAAEQLIVEIKNNENPVLPCFDPTEFWSVKKAKKTGVPEDRQVTVSSLKELRRTNDGINDVFGGLYEQLNLETLLPEKGNGKWNETLKACVLGRLAQPCSKHKTVKILEDELDIKLDLDHVYRMMDKVAANEELIKLGVARVSQDLLQEPVDVLLFDVTTLYFESTKADSVRNFGFSKDCKFNQTQVVLALVTTRSGLPITYELFPGNTYEGSTLVEIIKTLKTKYQVGEVVLVADRAMFNSKNLDQMDALGVQYVVAAKLRSLKNEAKSEILNSTLYRPEAIKQELHWTHVFDVDADRRLVVSYSSMRAHKDAADRKKILDKILKKEKDGKLKVTDLVNNQGSKKFVKITKNEATLAYDKIDRDVQWDGLHGVITNIKNKTSSEILTRYRDLWKIEEAFRINKHDLKMRPIYHWKPERVKAHIAICYIAFALLSYTRLRLGQAKVEISLETLREELLKAQSSVLVDTTTKTYFEIPSKITENQKKIYKAFGLRRKQAPSILTAQ